MDADDLNLPWRFWGYKKTLTKTDLSFSSQINFKRLLGLFTRQPAPIWLNSDEVAQVLARTNTLTHSTLIAKRHTLLELGGYEVVPAEDYNLWLRATLTGFRLHKNWFPRLLFRIHPGQITKNQDWLRKNSLSEVNDSLRLSLQSQLSSRETNLRWPQRLYLRMLDQRLSNPTNAGQIKGLGVSLLDSIIWRAGTLLVTLLVAYFCSVQQYALYGSAALATTFFQAILEGALRLQQVAQVRNARSYHILIRYSQLLLALSMTLLPLALVAITVSLHGTMSEFINVLPFVLALPVMRLSTLRQMKLQAYGYWNIILRYRVASIAASIAILVPLLVTFKSVLVGSVGLALSESIFLLFVGGIWRKLKFDEEVHTFQHLVTQRRFFDAVESQIHLWLRSQMDRVLVIGFASAKLVAFYLLLFTISRTPTETLSSGSNRYLKGLDLNPDEPSTYKALRKNLRIVQGLTLALVLILLLVIPIIQLVLPEHLRDISTALPLFAATAVPGALSAALFEYKFRNNPTFKYWQLYSLSIAFSVLIASCLEIYGLLAAGLALFTKEIVMATYWYRNNKIPWKANLAQQTFLFSVVALITGLIAFLSF